MFPTPTTITAAAQSPTATPAVRARLRNRHLSGAHRLIWSQGYTGSEPAGSVATVLTAAGTSITARVDTTTVYVRRVAAPGSGSAWGSWTALVAGAVSGTPVAVASFGSVVALYYNSSGNTVSYRVSRDDGVTWDAAIAGITFGAAVTKLATAVRPDSTGLQFAGGALFAAIGGPDLRAVAINPSWTMAGSSTGWAASATTITGVAAAYQRDFEVLVTGNTATTENAWGIVFGAGVQAAAGTWSARWEVATSDVTGVTFARPFVANIDGHLRFGWEENRTSAVARRTLMASYIPDAANGRWIDEAVREPAPVLEGPNRDAALAATPSMAVLTTSNAVYLAAFGESATFTAHPEALEGSSSASTTSPAGAILALTLDLEPGREHATLVIDSAATLPDILLDPGVELTLGFGYGDTVLDTTTLEVQSVTVEPGRVTFEATGIPEALARWRSRHARSFAAGTKTIAQSIAWLCARAGLPYPAQTNAASTTMSTAQPALTLAPRESAAAALRRLLALVPEVPHHVLGALWLTNPGAGDTPVYTAIGDAHPLLAARYTTAAPATTRALATSAAGLDERFDAALVARLGPREGAADDRSLTSGALLTVAADTLLREGALARYAATVRITPHPGLQVADVVTITDAALHEPITRRVAAIRLRYRTGARGEYVETLEFSGV